MNLEEIDVNVQKSLDEINELLSEAKKSEKVVNINDNILVTTNTEKVSLRNVEIEEHVDMLERLHLRIMGDSIDVLYRPNHDYICFVKNNEEGLETIKNLATMSREEFYDVLKKSSSFRFSSKRDLDSIKHSNKEEWYNKAWSIGTKQIFDKLKVENPIEEPLVV